MIINNASKLYTAYPTSKVNNVAKTAKTDGQKDVLAVSDLAKDYQKVRSALSQIPDVRQDKVSEIKARYNAGTYKVDAASIADKIMDIK